MAANVTTLKSKHAVAPDAEAPLVAEALARFAADLRDEDVPGEARRRARHLILDAVGIALASTGFDFAHRTINAVTALAGEGDGAVIGSALRFPMRDAAFLNGFLIHGLDYDDTHSGGIVHATSSVFPTVLAVGTRQRASGAELITAYVAGIEAASRLGAVAQGGFHQVGFHPTGLIGAFGCAIAAGKLMGLTEHQLTMAQGIALSLGSGSLEFLEDGAWNKRMHPGWAAVSGITAAALAQSGFVGAKRAYEGRFGLFPSHLGSHYDAAHLPLATEGLGRVWEIMQVAVKPYPVCHFVHACADAAVALVNEGLDPAAIEHVRALVPAEVVKTVCEPVANKRRPANEYDAKFSVPFIVAASLLKGRFTLAELEPETLSDPAVLALADRVDYEVDPQSGFPRYYSGELVVRTRDGRTLRHREAINRGSGDRPLADADIVAKYAANAGRVLSPAHADRIRALVLGIEEMVDVSILAEGLRRP
jgi:2-methylcitrate dehydratase PrpD